MTPDVSFRIANFGHTAEQHKSQSPVQYKIYICYKFSPEFVTFLNLNFGLEFIIAKQSLFMKYFKVYVKLYSNRS